MKIYWLEPGQEPMSDLSKQKKKRGFTMDDNPWLKIVIIGVIVLGLMGVGLWGCSSQKQAKAEATKEAQATAQAAAAATQTAEAPTPRPYVNLDTEAPPVGQPVEAAPASPLEPAQIAATATFQAAISRPAANPQQSPFFVGVVTYEDGCLVSNLGFTTSGYNGKPYYLYINALLDRDPNMQMANVRGYVQEFEDCQYPVIMVTELYWFGSQGTPAPLALGGAISGTNTITGTGPNPNMWGAGVVATKTPTYTVYIPPQKVLPTPEPLPTYTVYPTYTPQPVVKVTVPNYPTPTPPATATATPQAVTLFGPVVSVGGCSVSNFAISTDNQNYFIIFEGATLPAGDPTKYSALATGLASTACSGNAIRAQNITWYEPTPTPTPTATTAPTDTPTPTPTATATITPTATITGTGVITQ